MVGGSCCAVGAPQTCFCGVRRKSVIIAARKNEKKGRVLRGGVAARLTLCCRRSLWRRLSSAKARHKVGLGGGQMCASRPENEKKSAGNEFFANKGRQHYRNMSVVPTVRRPANTVGDRSAPVTSFCSENNTTETCPWCRLHRDHRRRSAYTRRSDNTVGDATGFCM